jgi:acetyltransferase-like isoleucine patch superfamily enzyme
VNIEGMLGALQRRLQRGMIDDHQRRVPLGDLLTDRWANAEEYGFGPGTSLYDNVLVIGDVRVGSNTWIGPNVVLDGSGGGLLIGDHCSISAGVQIYTHDTVDWATSLGAQPYATGATRIGSGVYVGPNTVISRGVTVGDRCVIGCMSFVNTDLPPRTRAWGCPAEVRGRVATAD